MVPPVTAERSPPASRTTGGGLAGDGGLVNGSSALDDTSPSPGICSPARTITRSPRVSSVPGTTVKCSLVLNGLDAMGLDILLGRTQGIGLGLTAALGKASAKFENRSVSHRMTAMATT